MNRRFKNGAEVAAAYIALRETHGLSFDDVVQRVIELHYHGRETARFPAECQVRTLEEDLCGSIEYIGSSLMTTVLLQAANATQDETDVFLCRCGVLPKDIVETLLSRQELFETLRRSSR